MDELTDLLSSILVTEEQVLSLLDEYSLYCHYLEQPVDTKKAYSSPLRTDSKPSFGIFENTRGRYSICEYKWKDSALNISGDIIDLVKHLYQLKTRDQALRQLDTEFELGLFTGAPPTNKKLHVYQKPQPKEPSQIRCKSVPIYGQSTRAHVEAQEYWRLYGIGKDLLQHFQVSLVQAFWTQPEQQAPYTPKGLCFSYGINGYYKIYQPFNPEFKFISNFPATYVEGWLQLPESGELCIITKSLKDVMVLASLGYASCSPRPETTPFPQHLLEQLKRRFSRVVTFFDNDYYGVDGKGEPHNHGQCAAALYGLPNIMLPDEYAKIRQKDISDFRKEHTEQKTQQLLTHLLHEI